MRQRVLVLEDEMLLAMLIEDMLSDLGFEVVGPAMHLDDGLRLAREAEIDCAVLDVNLGGDRRSWPVAAALRQRGIPFVFATGYGASGLSGADREEVVLRKPFTAQQLAKAIGDAGRRRQPRSPSACR